MRKKNYLKSLELKIRKEAAVPSWLIAMAKELFGSLDALGAGCCAFPPLHFFSYRQVGDMGPLAVQDKPISVWSGCPVSDLTESGGQK